MVEHHTDITDVWLAVASFLLKDYASILLEGVVQTQSDRTKSLVMLSASRHCNEFLSHIRKNLAQLKLWKALLFLASP